MHDAQHESSAQEEPKNTTQACMTCQKRPPYSQGQGASTGMNMSCNTIPAVNRNLARSAGGLAPSTLAAANKVTLSGT